MKKDWRCKTCGDVEVDHYRKMNDDPKHTIQPIEDVQEPEFTPTVTFHEPAPLSDPSPPIAPPMSARDFKRHCARIAANKEKGMATRLAAFGLGTFTELLLDAADEVLTGPKKKKLPSKSKRRK